jgi:hypothetical protein
MAYTYTTYIAALKAATVNGDLTTIKTQMVTDMSSAGLNATLVTQVTNWTDQIVNTNTFNKNFTLMNNAGSLFTILMGLNPPESSGAFYINDIVVIDPAVSDTGAVTTLTVINPINTAQTASTEIPSFLFTTNGRQWATGAITTQREINITAPTYSFVAASTITDAYTFYVTAPVAGTNATITNKWALGGSGSIQFIDGLASFSFQPLVGVPSYSSIYLGVTPSATNFALTSNGILTQLNGVTNLAFGISNGSQFSMTASNFTLTPVLTTSGASPTWQLTKPNNTGQTASTEISGIKYIMGSRQWATGAITTQREFYMNTPSYSFVGASTITTATTMYIDAPTAGTNATITNNYAALFNGSIGVLSDIQLGSVTTRVITTFLQIAAGTTAKSQMNLAVSTAPTSPVDGDVWREDNTNTGLKIRIGGVTKTIVVA